MAGAVGYLMTGGGQRPSAPVAAAAPAPTTVVNKTYVTKNYVQEAPKPAAPVSTYTASKPMSFSGSSSFRSGRR